MLDIFIDESIMKYKYMKSHSDCNNHSSHLFLSFPLFCMCFLYAYAISGKILLEKNDYHLIITVEMMVSGKFTGVCSLSLPPPPPPPPSLLLDVR
jgi:hypothetical protein